MFSASPALHTINFPTHQDGTNPVMRRESGLALGVARAILGPAKQVF
jgi:hypothetical protein